MGLEPVKFGARLFGYSRRQVLDYIDRTCAFYEQSLTQKDLQRQLEVESLRAQWQEKVALRDNALQQEAELNRQYADRLNTMQAAAEADARRLAQQQAALEERQKRLADETARADEFSARLEAAAARQAELEARLQTLTEEMAVKDGSILRQSEELTRLQSKVAALENTLSSARDDAEQSTALVNCVNLLHSRNRALTNKIAKLEAQLENEQSRRTVERLTEPVTERQEALKTAEAMFAALRKELAEALHTISDKIEKGSIQPDADDSRFVDLANL